MHELLSTQTVAPREQLDCWRDILCSSFVDMRIERPVDRSFRGQLARRSFGSVLVARVDAQAHDVVRRRVDEDAYLISIQTRGHGIYTQDSRVASISSGGISVLDCRSPFEIAFPGEFSTLTIKVPRPSLRVRPSSPKSLGGLSLPARTGLTRLVRDYVQRLLTVGAEADMAVREALACNLCDLMGLAVNVPSREDIASGPASVLLDAILLHIKGNLADPDLSPPKVADHFGISVRYLHKLFEQDQFHVQPPCPRAEAAALLRGADRRPAKLKDRGGDCLCFGVQRPFVFWTVVPPALRSRAIGVSQGRAKGILRGSGALIAAAIVHRRPRRAGANRLFWSTDDLSLLHR